MHILLDFVNYFLWALKLGMASGVLFAVAFSIAFKTLEFWL